MKLSEALAAAKKAREYHETRCTGYSCCYGNVTEDLIDAVEETLLARQKEADVLLDLAELRRWRGSE